MPSKTQSGRAKRANARHQGAQHSDIADVLCNEELYKYADELREQAKHDLLLDLAQHVYAAATERGGVKCDEVREPSELMTLDQLHDAIMSYCTCGIEKLGYAGKVRQYETALRHVAKRGQHQQKQQKHQQKQQHKNVKHITVTSAPYMAKQLIRAQCYEGQPESTEAQRCQQKGISWKMDVDDDRVTVTRDRVGGETHRYTYQCPSEKEYQKLLKQTAKTRDNVLKKGHF